MKNVDLTQILAIYGAILSTYILLRQVIKDRNARTISIDVKVQPVFFNTEYKEIRNHPNWSNERPMSRYFPFQLIITNLSSKKIYLDSALINVYFYEKEAEDYQWDSMILCSLEKGAADFLESGQSIKVIPRGPYLSLAYEKYLKYDQFLILEGRVRTSTGLVYKSEFFSVSDIDIKNSYETRKIKTLKRKNDSEW